MNIEILRSIISNDQTHAKWLNTFSYLEYIGFRKIIKSQPSSRMNLALLSHAVEEGRHALRLKKLAMKIGGATFESYTDETMICADEASTYFQSLDQRCAELLNVAGDSWLTYLYVTWLVELRAIDIYRDYSSVSASHLLHSLIGEEVSHLDEVRSQLQKADSSFTEHSHMLRLEEEALYQQFCGALEKEISRA